MSYIPLSLHLQLLSDLQTVCKCLEICKCPHICKWLCICKYPHISKCPQICKCPDMTSPSALASASTYIHLNTSCVPPLKCEFTLHHGQRHLGGIVRCAVALHVYDVGCLQITRLLLHVRASLYRLQELTAAVDSGNSDPSWASL